MNFCVKHHLSGASPIANGSPSEAKAFTRSGAMTSKVPTSDLNERNDERCVLKAKRTSKSAGFMVVLWWFNGNSCGFSWLFFLVFHCGFSWWFYGALMRISWEWSWGFIMEFIAGLIFHGIVHGISWWRTVNQPVCFGTMWIVELTVTNMNNYSGMMSVDHPHIGHINHEKFCMVGWTLNWINMD